MTIDPTADEMRAFLTMQQCGDYDEFATEEAIYWFANDYHGGQASNLYSALSTGGFRPGPCANGPEDDYLYEALEYEYAGRVSCDQCEMLSINGVACHERGCPNIGARWDKEQGEWIKQYECRECGFTVDKGYSCDCAQSPYPD